MNTEDRLRNALEDHAASVPKPPDRWAEVEADAARIGRRNRWRRGGFTGLGLVAAASVVVLAVGALNDGGQRVVTRPADTPPAMVAPAPDTPPLLWPFRTVDEARQWQEESEPEGHSPWHADPEATALAFTTGYLGFTAIDQVVDAEVTGDEAVVTVGYRSEEEGQRAFPAARIRLLRLGEGATAPWEVVGTAEDEYFSITAPEAGATVSSPLEVAGRITGVDESIHVQVRQPSTPDPLGESPCCGADGGEDSPWARTVTVDGATDPVLTVVAHTGGHITDVERFVVVGVRPPTR
ncbi:MAG: hypothetical protein ACRDZ3_03825 [Acidimicrobiia bacterium]